MSQTRVTEFFSTRKRNQLQEEAAAIAKSKAKSIQSRDEETTETTPTKRCLRSSTRQLKAIDVSSKQAVVEAGGAKETTTKTGRDAKRSEKNEKLEQLKARIQRLDEQSAKLMDEEKKETTKTIAKPADKKKLNKDELKKKIEAFNRNLVQLQAEPSKEAIDEKSIEKEEKHIQTELPAYEKLKNLATSDIDTIALALPKSYSLLFDYFKGSDTIVKFLSNRDEICTFHKLKMGIQNITKRAFTHKQLAQIKTVYPLAYLFKYEKLFIDSKHDYHLIISPNLDEIETNPQTGLKQFTPKVLLERIAKFKANLLSIVKKLHQEFLESIGIKDFNSENLRRWHPKFDLENVKEIEQADLPKPPVDDSIKCKTGKELLNIARDIYSTRIQDAIKKSVVDQPKEECKKDENEKGSEKTALTITVEVSVDQKPGSTQYSALLEKIRNKEKQKAFETMVIKNNESDKVIAKHRAFTEATRFIINFFQSEKKSTLEIDKVVRKMSENMKSNAMNEFECRDLLNEMSSAESVFAKANKKWLNFIKVRGQTYLQVDKAIQLNDLIVICEEVLKNLN